MTPEEQKKPVVIRSGGGTDAVYGIGMIGAWVYYLKRATTNQERALGLARGLVWPAFLVYALLAFLEDK
jgi:phage gp29-like protein